MSANTFQLQHDGILPKPIWSYQYQI